MALFGGNRGGVHAHHTHLWPTLALAFLSWVILLAGLSSVQDECRASQTQFPDSASGFIHANNLCSSRYRFPWWVLWLAFAVFLGVAVTSLFGHLPRARVALSSFLAFLAVLLVLQTDNFLSIHDAVGSSARITTTFVGFLLTTIFTLGLIISIGTIHDGTVDNGVVGNRGTTATTTSKV